MTPYATTIDGTALAPLQSSPYVDSIGGSYNININATSVPVSFAVGAVNTLVVLNETYHRVFVDTYDVTHEDQSADVSGCVVFT